MAYMLCDGALGSSATCTPILCGTTVGLIPQTCEATQFGQTLQPSTIVISGSNGGLVVPTGLGSLFASVQTVTPNAPREFILPPVSVLLGVPTPTSSSAGPSDSSIGTSSGSSTRPTQTSPSATASSQSQVSQVSQGVNVGVVAGVAVVSAVVATAATVLLLWCWRRRRRSKSSKRESFPEAEAPESGARRSSLPAVLQSEMRVRPEMVVINRYSQEDGSLIPQMSSIGVSHTAVTGTSEKRQRGMRRDPPSRDAIPPDTLYIDRGEYIRRPRQETDGGLAGRGRLGESPGTRGMDDDQQSESVGSMLPPPYSPW